MSDRVRKLVAVASTLLILGVANFLILDKERIVRDGTLVLLRLAPVDPRSLLQGDYMALRYAMTDAVGDAARAEGISNGVAVVELDESAQATFVSLYQGQPVQQDQALLRFRRRADSVRIASDAFFFEEGRFETYSDARFGELRVDESGDAVLTGLRDSNGRILGIPLHARE